MMTKLKRGDLVYLSGKAYEGNHTGSWWQTIESHAIYMGLLPGLYGVDQNFLHYSFYQSNGQTCWIGSGQTCPLIGHCDDDRPAIVAAAASCTGSWKDLLYALSHNNHRLKITLPDGTVH